MENNDNENKKMTFYAGRALLVIVALLMCCVTILKAAEPVKSTVVVIVNKDVAETTMTQKDIEAIFLGKKTKWDNKAKITILTLKSGDVHTAFVTDYVNSTAAKFKSHWKKQVFTGKADAPDDFKTEKEMIEKVSKTKGAIGYVSVEFLNKNPDLVKNLVVTK